MHCICSLGFQTLHDFNVTLLHTTHLHQSSTPSYILQASEVLPRVKLVCTHKAHFFKHSQTNEVVYSLARVTHKCTMALVPRPVVATCISILCRGSMLQHNTQLIFYLLHIRPYLQSQAQALVLLNPLAPAASPSRHPHSNSSCGSVTKWSSGSFLATTWISMRPHRTHRCRKSEQHSRAVFPDAEGI